MGIRDYIQKVLPKQNRRSRFTGLLLIAGGVAAALILAGFFDFYDGLDGGWFEFIMCGVFIILGLIIFAVSFMDKNMKTQQDGLEELARNYGDADAALKEIESEFKNFMVYTTDYNSFITRDWYILGEFKHYFKISDIAAIVGIMGEGTYIITIHGHVVEDMFGGNPNWGLIVNELLMPANPHILIRGDNVLLPDGRWVDVYDAYRMKAFDAIINTFLANKED